MQHGARSVAVPRGDDVAPLVVAHRGAWGAAPQNSLAAFADAVAIGCDAIELDVRRTRDERIVVVHDARVRGRPVGRLEHQELQARLKPGQAPLLEEALEFAAGRILVDLELKQAGYEEAVMTIVTRHLTPEQYVITSFRDSVLPEVKRHAPEARTGLLLRPGHGARDLDRRVEATRADFLAPHASLAEAGVLDWAAQHERASWVWTVNGLRALRALHADLRVTALITDRPEQALDLLRATDGLESRE